MTGQSGDEQLRREECRRDVRDFLAARQAKKPLRSATIRRKLDEDFSMEEIDSALAFLGGLNPPEVVAVLDPDGATKYFRITSDGVLASERGWTRCLESKSRAPNPDQPQSQTQTQSP